MTDLPQLAIVPDDKIDTSDIPEMDFSKGVRGKFYTGDQDIKHYDLAQIRPMLKVLGARLTRKRYATTPIREYLQQLEPTELAEKYVAFYDNHLKYKEVPAGVKHHHWWIGGLEDHVREMIGI